MDRRDKIGRKIGYNWWRDHIVSSWFAADCAWRSSREYVAMGYATENNTFAIENPRPTLKNFMIQLANPTREYYVQEF